MRILLHKRHQSLGKYRTERIGDPDIKSTGKNFLEIIYPVAACLGIVKSTYGQRKQFAATFRKIHRMAATLEKLHFQFILKLFNLLRKRALSKIQGTRRIRETQCLGCLDEISKLSEFHNPQRYYIY